jgi:hypothetical protein
MELLNAHPNIHALSEEFNDPQENGSAAQLEWVRRYFTPPLIGRYKVIGFNTKLENVLDPNELAKLMKKYKCKVINLQRRNRIKGTVSYFVGKKLSEATGMWGLFKEENRPSAVYIDPDEFDEHLQIREQLQRDQDRYINNLGLPALSLCYEDLSLDKDGVLKQVFSFFHIKPLTVKATALKITSDNLRNAILNFDELKSRYIGTQYENMFDEILVPPSSN